MSGGVDNSGKSRSSDGRGSDDRGGWRVGDGVMHWSRGIGHMSGGNWNSVLLNGGVSPASSGSGDNCGTVNWSRGDGGVTEMSWRDGGVSGDKWGDDSSLSTGSGLGVSNGVLNLGIVNFRGVHGSGDGDGGCNWESVGGNTVSVVVSGVMGGEWDSFGGDVGEDSSNTTGRISHSSMTLGGLRVTESSLTKLVLRVVLSLGGDWGGDHGGRSNDWSRHDGRVSKTVSISGVGISGMGVSGVGVWESSRVVEDLCRTDCQDGSENGNDLHIE
jgi:hypothetical protein